MCGFAGFLANGANWPASEWPGVLGRMGDAIAHRGPDDAGIWMDASVGVGLIHRRLSILDLSPAGHQPMLSAAGRYVLVFNGEIYNHLDLRAEVEQWNGGSAVSGNGRQDSSRGGSYWVGYSDTETLLACVETWGLEKTLQKAVGMFAFALWDRQDKRLHLARDRIGEKPLYYGWMGGTFLFGSELKALRAHPAWREDIDREALALYLRHNYVPAPHSIYRGIRKLLPGAYLTLSADVLAPGETSEPTVYWSARRMAEAGVQTPFALDDAAASAELERLLRQAVQRQMVADVPLGAFLSGGYDSSLVVALMQSLSSRPVQTFTIGFHEHGYNEAEHAKAVARHLCTEHTELYVTPQEALAVVPRLPAIYDEPFADSSQIPTLLVSEMTRRHVTVALSGDGGDELFGGYNRYFWGRKIWHRIGWLPRPVRQVGAAAMQGLSPQQWDAFYGAVAPILPQRLQSRLPGDKLHKLASILASATPDELYRGLVSHWQPSDLMPDTAEPFTALTDPARQAALSDFTQRMMFLDLVSYMPDDILVKVDRASMAVSLEARVPFLDHRVVELAWRLPLAQKIRGGQGKWLLRQVLYRYVPEALVDRPKMGFGVPIDAWLRGPLRDWAETLLDENRLRSEGFFAPTPIRQKWAEHLTGRRNWAYHLWDVLMFQAWLEAQSL